jgi:hypothetical protein
MYTDNPWRKAILDGLVAVAVVMIAFFVVLIFLFFSGGYSRSISGLLDAIGLMFFFRMPDVSSLWISPMPFVLLIAFLGAGISGKSFAKIESRSRWVLPTLIISCVSWLVGAALLLILFRSVRSGMILAVGAGIGFLFSVLLGIILNPERHVYRIAIGAISSTVIAYVAGVLIAFMQIP